MLAWVGLAHWAGHYDNRWLSAAALALLSGLILWSWLGRYRFGGILAACLAVLLGGILVALGPAAAVLMTLPPVLIPAALAWGFAGSLRYGRQALITRFVRISEGSERAEQAAVVRYTRRLTALWALLLGSLALVALLLALLAVPNGLLQGIGWMPPWPLPRTVWNVWANGYAYAVPGLAFLLEWWLRPHLLAGSTSPPPWDFARALWRHWPELRGTPR